MYPRDTALHLDSSNVDPVSPTPRITSRIRATARGALLGCTLVPLGLGGSYVLEEWKSLQVEEQAAAASAVIGYPNIFPAVSQAAKPVPARYIDGDQVRIWSGWDAQRGHCWFSVGCDECDPASLGDPIGRDVARAIDYPAVETGGGEIWERIPAAADMIGLSVGKTACAYPRMVLAKVLVVNDLVEGTPRLVHLDPFAPALEAVAVYDPRLDGRRITLGSTGFSMGGKHVLYDRGTESLWADGEGALVAFSGPHKGKKLALVERGKSVSWSEWRDENPGSRLVVGSLDRRAAPPSE
ncbi:DUF3179 domain-containing (seleno)protein [Paludisphaera soli]|uniref:DUF3179 domain-containing (seleno)protein n=1 Tax=Paludisphaera soli TaxID=2712865 RepID=UPI0013EA2552|nr:DUF3179 domain-containing (seleno)protein [Paludisphaera soli]